MDNKKNTSFDVYLYTLVILALAVSVFVFIYYPIDSVTSFLFFVIIAIIAESQSVTLISGTAVTITPAIYIAAMYIGGFPCVLGATLGASLFTFYRDSDGRYVLMKNMKYIFINAGNYVISMYIASLVFKLLGGIFYFEIVSPTSTDFGAVLHLISQNAVPFILSMLVSVFMNTLIFTIGIIAQTHSFQPLQWIKQFLWAVTGLILVIAEGLTIIAIYISYGWLPVTIFFIPLVLARNVFVMYNELTNAYEETIRALVDAIDTKDKYTGKHSQRVAAYSELCARYLGLSHKRRQMLRYAALLHDVGKIGIQDSVLRKPGRLTNDEFNIIKTHPDLGTNIIKQIKFLRNAADIVRYHHLGYDGKGYPALADGKIIKDIPIEAFIIASADAFDAMISDRPYRNALPVSVAIEELKTHSGTQFHPQVVNAFLKMLDAEADEIKKIQNTI